MPPIGQPASTPDYALALEAARRGDEDAVLAALKNVSLRDGPEATSDELWLRAELTHLEGRGLEVVPRFEAFERRTARSKAPAWQRYGSAHRRMIALYFQGELDRAKQVLVQAERIIADHPDLRFRQPNIDAMHGHFLELEGDSDAAKARFLVAYDLAADLRNWSRAATIAADIARIAADQRQDAEALAWLRQAREANDREPSRRVQQVIDVRFARVYRVMQRYAEAREIYDRVLKDPIPDREESALVERAELHAEEGSFTEAEADWKRAIELCESRGTRLVALGAYRYLAHMYLARGDTGDETRTAEAFGRYAKIVLSFHPAQPRLVMELAEDVLTEPRLIRRSRLPGELSSSLRAALEELRANLKPTPYRRALRRVRTRAALDRVQAELLFLEDPEIRLASWTILTATRRMLPRSKSGSEQRVTPTELVALDLLLRAPAAGWTMTEIADRMNKSYDAASKTISRLRELLEPDLITQRRGNTRVYSVSKSDP